MYDIEKYWTRRLGRSATTRESTLKGWVGNPVPISSFVEPALTLREGDPDNADIIIVAAPGAVGKTTFAQALARTSGFAYVDLSQTSPLGGNFFTGGLTNAFGLGALQEAAEGNLGIIVDGLDEAQLRATPEGFAAGLADLATIVRASSRVLPPVLFGRSLAADEAWLTLNSAGRRPCIFEIEFFDDQRAEKYLAARLQALAEASPRKQAAFSRHRERFVALAHETRARLAAAGGDMSARFTGYAPILDAICSFALDEDELNPQSKFSKLGGETQVELVNNICTAVLKREQSKLLAQLSDVCPAEHRSSIETLYDPDDQRARLSSALFGAPAPKFPTLPTPALSQAFGNMVQQFFPIHPFLDGSRMKAANAVFAADILVSSLVAPDRKDAARRAARDDQRLMTGVVFDLYMQHLKLPPLTSLLTAFRSHSKGKLVRYAPKIDHLRMTKDRRGAFLVDQLLGDGVLSSFDGGRFYVLDPDRMARLMNMDYFRLQQQQFTNECDAYLGRVLAKLP